MTMTAEIPGKSRVSGRMETAPKEFSRTLRGLTRNQSLLDRRAAVQSIEWRPVVGYEGLYEVSSDGKVRNVSGRILKQSTGSKGHLRVGLSSAGSHKNKSVHRLVALAFHGEPEEGQEVCHGNGDPADNRVENLRWDTRRNNQLDSVRHGTHAKARMTHCAHGHELTAENTYISSEGARRCHECRKADKRLEWQRLEKTPEQRAAATERVRVHRERKRATVAPVRAEECGAPAKRSRSGDVCRRPVGSGKACRYHGEWQEVAE